MTSTRLTEDKRRIVELAYSRSCDRLEAQQSIAAAADQRALVFGTLSVGAASLLFEALSEKSDLGVGAAAFLGAGAFFSVLSAFPSSSWFTSGSHARDLNEFVDGRFGYHSVLRGLAKHNDCYIDENERSASTRASLYRAALVFFVVGIVLAVLGFLTASPAST